MVTWYSHSFIVEGFRLNRWNNKWGTKTGLPGEVFDLKYCHNIIIIPKQSYQTTKFKPISKSSTHKLKLFEEPMIQFELNRHVKRYTFFDF